MRKREIAEPYAAALANLVQSTPKNEIVPADFYRFLEIYQTNSELKEFLLDPLVDKKIKKELVEKIFKSLNTILKSFLNLLIDRSRIELISLIAEKYSKILYTSDKSEIAYVSSRIPLTEKQENFIIKNLESKLNIKEIIFYSALDSSLFAGLKIIIGSNVIDLSLKGQLFNISQNLDLGSRFKI